MTDDRETMPPMPADEANVAAFGRIEQKLDTLTKIASDILEELQRQSATLRDHEERLRYLMDTDPSELNGHGDG